MTSLDIRLAGLTTPIGADFCGDGGCAANLVVTLGTSVTSAGDCDTKLGTTGGNWVAAGSGPWTCTRNAVFA